MTTTRSLKVLHLVGQAAALTYRGTQDSQIVLLQGGISKDPSERLVFDEDQRALDLCNLIRDLGVDGIARMNAGFEVLLCDYEHAGVESLLSSNTTVPGSHKCEDDPTLPKDPNRISPHGYGNELGPQSSWEWIRRGTWHYGVSANDASITEETRIQLDLCSFLTYYDPYLRNLINRGRGLSGDRSTFQNGWGFWKGQRLTNISKPDVDFVKDWVKQLHAPTNRAGAQCS